VYAATFHTAVWSACLHVGLVPDQYHYSGARRRPYQSFSSKALFDVGSENINITTVDVLVQIMI